MITIRALLSYQGRQEVAMGGGGGGRGGEGRREEEEEEESRGMGRGEQAASCGVEQ